MGPIFHRPPKVDGIGSQGQLLPAPPLLLPHLKTRPAFLSSEASNKQFPSDPFSLLTPLLACPHPSLNACYHRGASNLVHKLFVRPKKPPPFSSPLPPPVCESRPATRQARSPSLPSYYELWLWALPPPKDRWQHAELCTTIHEGGTGEKKESGKKREGKEAGERHSVYLSTACLGRSPASFLSPPPILRALFVTQPPS